MSATIVHSRHISQLQHHPMVVAAASVPAHQHVEEPPIESRKLLQAEITRLKVLMKPQTLTPKLGSSLTKSLVIDPTALLRNIITAVTKAPALKGFHVEIDDDLRLIGSAVRYVFDESFYNDIDFSLPIHFKGPNPNIRFLVNHTSEVIQEILKDELFKLYCKQHPKETKPSRHEVFHSFLKMRNRLCDIVTDEKIGNRFAIYKFGGIELKFPFNTDSIPGLEYPCASNIDVMQIRLKQLIISGLYNNCQMTVVQGTLEEAKEVYELGEIATDILDGRKFCKFINFLTTRHHLKFLADQRSRLFQKFSTLDMQGLIQSHLRNADLSPMQERAFLLNIATIAGTLTDEQRLERLRMVLRYPHTQLKNKEHYSHNFIADGTLCCLLKFSLIEEFKYFRGHVDLNALIDHLSREPKQDVLDFYKNEEYRLELCKFIERLPFKEFFITTLDAWVSSKAHNLFTSKESAALSFLNLLKNAPSRQLWDYAVENEIFSAHTDHHLDALSIMLEYDPTPSLLNALGTYLPIERALILYRKLITSHFSENAIPYLKFLGIDFIQDNLSCINDCIGKISSLELLYELLKTLRELSENPLQETSMRALKEHLKLLKRDQYELGLKIYMSFFALLKDDAELRLILARKLIRSQVGPFIQQAQHLIDPENEDLFTEWITTLLRHYKALNSDEHDDNLSAATSFFVIALNAVVCSGKGHVLSLLLEQWCRIPKDSKFCNYTETTALLLMLLKRHPQVDANNTFLFVKNCSRIIQQYFSEMAWQAIKAYHTTHPSDELAYFEMHLPITIAGMQRDRWVDTYIFKICGRLFDMLPSFIEAHHSEYVQIGTHLSKKPAEQKIIDLILKGLRNVNICRIWHSAHLLKPLLENLRYQDVRPMLIALEAILRHHCTDSFYKDLIEYYNITDCSGLSPQEQCDHLLPALQCFKEAFEDDPFSAEHTFGFIAGILIDMKRHFFRNYKEENYFNPLWPLLKEIMALIVTTPHPPCNHFTETGVSQLRVDFMLSLTHFVAMHKEGLPFFLNFMEKMQEQPSELLRFTELSKHIAGVLDCLLIATTPLLPDALSVFFTHFIRVGLRPSHIYSVLRICAVHRVPLPISEWQRIAPLATQRPYTLTFSLMCVGDTPMPACTQLMEHLQEAQLMLFKKYQEGDSSYPFILSLIGQTTIHPTRLEIPQINDRLIMLQETRNTLEWFLKSLRCLQRGQECDDTTIGYIVQHLFIFLRTRLEQLGFSTMHRLASLHCSCLLSFYCCYLNASDLGEQKAQYARLLFFLNDIEKVWKTFLKTLSV